MVYFNEERFSRFILEQNVIGFGKPKRLSSGKTSHWYVNWRRITDDAFLTEKLIDFIIDLVCDLDFKPSSFYGVPEGATKLGALTTFEWAKRSPNYGIGSHVLSMGRKEPKRHGDEPDRYFIGIPRGKTIVLEDVTTTGESLLKKGLSYVKDHASNAQLIATLTLTTRMTPLQKDEFSTKVLEDYGIQAYAMSDALQLLPEAYQRQKPGEHIGALVEEELAQEGVIIKLR